MTFRDIVSAVLANGFDETDRADAKTWVVARHAWLWDAYDWTFKQQTATVTFPASGQVVTGTPTDLQAVLAVYAATGYPLTAKDPTAFYNEFNPAYGITGGQPSAYTMIGGSLLVDTGDGSTGTLLYERSKPALVNDDDATGLPDGFDLALVHGGKAEGFTLRNVPLADTFEQKFGAAVNALTGANLVTVKQTGRHFRSYRPC